MTVGDDDDPMPFEWIRARVVDDESGVEIRCGRCGETRKLIPGMTEAQLRRETEEMVFLHQHCKGSLLQ